MILAGTTTTATSMTTGWHTGLAWVTVAACALACIPSGLRWLRVAQREHYLAGSVGRFAGRWWRISPVNRSLAVAMVAAGVASLWCPVAGVVVGAIVAVGPLGLSLKGRTSKLAWTRRLRTLALVWAGLEVIVVGAGILTGLAAPLAVVAALASPFLVDGACALVGPVENRLAGRFVDEATTRLDRVRPTVVAITGSYGKTSTKGHLAHLVGSSRAVVATPASFNNRAGLARAINEHLADGTEVFVAEMGTYGPGEIADLCRWCPPAISVITAIGPVHLERFGSEDRIVEAKSEILRTATDVVLPVDDPRLAALADQAVAAGQRVHRCSAVDRTAEVCVVRGHQDEDDVSVFVHGEAVAVGVVVPTGVQPVNLACAVAVAIILGVTTEQIVERMKRLPAIDHRLRAARSPSGVLVLDDTYNANPAGAVEALRALKAAPDHLDGMGHPGRAEPASAAAPAPAPTANAPRLVVVTPGLVELGPRQPEENRRFGAAIARTADHLVVVGRTNRQALREGAASGPSPPGTVVTTVRDREEAVAWVRSHLGAGDAVLYENDLPDHYP